MTDSSTAIPLPRLGTLNIDLPRIVDRFQHLVGPDRFNKLEDGNGGSEKGTGFNIPGSLTENIGALHDAISSDASITQYREALQKAGHTELKDSVHSGEGHKTTSADLIRKLRRFSELDINAGIGQLRSAYEEYVGGLKLQLQELQTAVKAMLNKEKQIPLPFSS